MSGNYRTRYPNSTPEFSVRNLDIHNGNAPVNLTSSHGKHMGLAQQGNVINAAGRPIMLSRGGQGVPHPMLGTPVLGAMAAMQMQGGVGGMLCSSSAGIVRLGGSSPMNQRGILSQAMHHAAHHPGPQGDQGQGRKRRHNQQSPMGGGKHSRVDSRGQPGQDGQRLGQEQQPARPMGGDKMSDAMWQYFVSHVQSSEDYSRKKLLRDSLYQVLHSVFPYCGLYIVGSSLSGFATKKSDVDMCLMLSGDYIDQKREATEILFLIHRAIRKCSFVRESEVIRAKVPILKFKDSISCVECDLNINNSVGIRNTHLLRYYANADPRVRPLMLFIKHWARFHDINDARKMTISSYSLGLMLVHYLQVGCKPAVLPSLQQLFPGRFNPDTDVRDLRLDEALPIPSPQNRMSLGELFLGFLDYYCHKFDFSRDVISVRMGCRLSRTDVAGRATSPNQWKYLCVEEPFDKSNTARAVYDPYTFQRICRVFRVSLETLEKTRDVTSLFRDPF